MADLTRDGFTQDRISIRRSLDMRYVGQVHECTVEIDPFALTDDALIKLIEAFHARHEELYTYSERQSVVEIVNVESAIWGRVDRPNRMTVAKGKGAASALEGTRPMIFDAGAVAHDARVQRAVAARSAVAGVARAGQSGGAVLERYLEAAGAGEFPTAGRAGLTNRRGHGAHGGGDFSRRTVVSGRAIAV